MNDDIIQKVVADISKNHNKIIDDWCKAYLSQLYQEKGSIKPGDFMLVEQVPTMRHDGLFVKKYWFEKIEGKPWE